MFQQLKHVLMLVYSQIADTKLSRTFLVLAVVVPLVTTMYGYFDQVLLDSKQALNTINSQSVSVNGFSIPLGSYFISYLNVAQVDLCLATVFGYAAFAMVWSFTTDLKPAFVGGKK